ncbi:MAG: hypothetical protein ACJ768_09815 [Gaiellaceae bacterium]
MTNPNVPPGSPGPYGAYGPPGPPGYVGPRPGVDMAAFKRRQRKRMIVVLAALTVVVGGAVALMTLVHDPSDANAGDCLSGTSADTMKIRKCTDPEATFKVVKKYDSVWKEKAGTKCDPVPGVTRYFYQGGDYGTVLCLAPARP